MAYIGQQPVVGRYILLDQISGGFNGTTSGFTMSTAGGVQGVKPGLAQNVLLSLGGVIQQPGVDYTISGSGITFTTPPVSGTTFFATVLGDAQSVGTPSDGTVTPASIAAGFDFAFPNVNVTGVTTIASGSAATPSLSITGDSNTGLLSPAANTLAVSTSGTQRLVIDNSGNVGINETSPGQRLVVGGDMRIGFTTPTDAARSLVFDSNRSSAAATLTNITFNWNSTAVSQIRAIAGADTTNKDDGELAFFTSAANSILERLRIDSSGRVGIGTSSPNVPLHVYHATTNGVATFESGDADALINFRDNSTTNSPSIGAVGNSFKVITSSTERLRIDSSGRLLVGTSSDFTNGTGTAIQSVASAGGQIALGRDNSSLGNGFLVGRLRWYGNSGGTAEEVARISVETDNTHALGDKPGRLSFHTTADNASSPTERMRIDSSGNVGIGTTSPANTLHVDKDTGSTPTVYINNSGGDSGDGVALKVQASGRGTGIADASVFSVHNNASEIFTVRNDGNVGIGTTSPGRNLVVNSGASSGYIQLVNTNSGTASSNGFELKLDSAGAIVDLINRENGAMRFFTNNTERMRIDSSGRLLVGTTSARAHLNDGSDSGHIFLEGTTQNTSTLAVTRNSNNDGPSHFVLGKSRGGSANSTTIVQSGDTIGQINFEGADGTHLIRAAQISCAVDGTPGANDMPGRLVFFTTADGASSATERMRIDSSGNVGIGASSPSAKLDVAGNQLFSAANPQIQFNAGGPIIRLPSANTLAFLTDSTNERMRIDSSGRLLIGSSSSRAAGYGDNASLQLEGTTYPKAAISAILNVNNTDGPSINFAKSRGTSNGSSTIVQSGDNLGVINFSGGDGTDIKSAGVRIRAQVDGTPGSNDMPGRISVETTPDGSVSPVERVRITSDGRLLVGTTTSYGRVHVDEDGMFPDGGAWLSASIVTSGSFGGGVSLLDGSKGYTMFCTENGDDFFIRGATSTTANVTGGVKLDNRATSWTSASDEREKENLVSITGAIGKVKTLRTVTGNYTWAPDKDYAFLIAQDVQQVLPEAVSVMNKSAAVEEQRLGIAYTQTIPLLTAALKEAIAKIETLETSNADLLARVTALES